MRTAAAVVRVLSSLATMAKVVSSVAAVALVLLGGGCTGELDLRELWNLPPTADAGEDQVTPPGYIVPLVGSRSRDVNGDALTYCWTQTAGPTVELSGADQAIAHFTPAESGTYVFRLTVSDEYGAADECETVITVDASANLGADQNGVSNDAGDPSELRPVGVDVPVWDGQTIYGGWFGRMSQRPIGLNYAGGLGNLGVMSITVVNAADPANRKVCIVFENGGQATFTTSFTEQTVETPDGFTQTFLTRDGKLSLNDNSFRVSFISCGIVVCGTVKFTGTLIPEEGVLEVTYDFDGISREYEPPRVFVTGNGYFTVMSATR